MKIVRKFDTWQRLNEQEELDVKTRAQKKADRKKNKRKFRTERFASESGGEYVLIKQKDDKEDQDTFTVKGKGKKSPIWDKEGKVLDDVRSFIDAELFSGQNEGKYDNESIEMEKYKEGARKDKVTFSIKLVDQEAKKAEAAEAEEEAKKAKEEEEAKKVEAEKLTIPANEEGENRIEIGQSSPVLPKIKELIRKTFVKKGFKMGSAYGMDWLDSDKLEEKDAVWIKALRAGFGMKIADFISQGLVDKISAQVAEWEKPAEEEEKEETETNESRVFNFNSYLKMLEQFDMEAAMKQMQQEAPKEEKPAKKKAATGGSGGSAPSTGFSQEEGDKFRQWANSTDELKKKYGKPSKYDLDATGEPDNNFIRKAYAAAKSEYEASKKSTTSIFNDDEDSELKKSMQADYEIANDISNKLIKFWKSNPGAGIFKPFKGVIDDDEDKALKGAYDPWLTSSGIRKQFAKLKNPYYRKTMNGVIYQTKVEMTDMVGNSVSWTLLNPSKLKGIADEGLKQLATYEPPAKTWIGSDLDYIGNKFAKAIGYKPQMSRYRIPGNLFDF